MKDPKVTIGKLSKVSVRGATVRRFARVKVGEE